MYIYIYIPARVRGKAAARPLVRHFRARNRAIYVFIYR